jgi:hypothetical protein
MLTGWANAAAEAVEAFVRMCSCESPLTQLSCSTDGLGVEMETLDLSKDGAELDVVGAMTGDLGVEPPVIELQYCLLQRVV